MKPKNPPTDRRRRARSAFEYLDQEEQRATEALKASLLAAGEDLCQITDVRGLVRRHPVVALGAGAALGAALSPILADALRGAIPGGHASPGGAGKSLGVWLRRLGKPG
ncbi:MAG: hypothetical protein NTY35_02830 [Planctomycetota bacterium]|nr:hypothetical protein [Planctomycetota bacterium]